MFSLVNFNKVGFYLFNKIELIRNAILAIILYYLLPEKLNLMTNIFIIKTYFDYFEKGE